MLGDLQAELHASTEARLEAREARRRAEAEKRERERRTDEFGILLPPRSPSPVAASPTDHGEEAEDEEKAMLGTSGVARDEAEGKGLNLGRSGKDLWELVRVRMIRSGEMKKRIVRNDILDYPVGIYARFVPHTGEFQKPPNVRAKTHATKAMKELMRVKDLIDQKKGKVPENQLILLDAERRFYLKAIGA